MTQEKSASSEAAVEPVSGGWSMPKDTKITEEHKKLFEKACETLTGATYTPIAFLGSQVVAGTNYRFLVKMEPSVQDLNGKATYAIVVIYEDLKGNASITETKESDVELPPTGEMLVGAYEEAQDPALTAEVKTAFDQATSTLTGVEYTPVLLRARLRFLMQSPDTRSLRSMLR